VMCTCAKLSIGSEKEGVRLVVHLELTKLRAWNETLRALVVERRTEKHMVVKRVKYVGNKRLF
jgi:hypothetical protein